MDGLAEPQVLSLTELSSEVVLAAAACPRLTPASHHIGLAPRFTLHCRLAEVLSPTDILFFLFSFFFIQNTDWVFFLSSSVCVCVHKSVCVSVAFVHLFGWKSRWRVPLLGPRLLQFSLCFENITRYQESVQKKKNRRSIRCCESPHSCTFFPFSASRPFFSSVFSGTPKPALNRWHFENAHVRP